ncbi:hypothetical protein OB2597_16280 [Pseudooceanicola batsensis HTCC2597]|uniref:Regulator of SigK n=1 Tax=Pseudooceanicola batsensis (strain ATCC BAA-863 / DSM 15984 / KCTC 12145 / HTCC2597) TaxID=252305 RepID=A3TZD8_PSEBH|nr:anti-sigma factor [Pseudooceanicola batsensis]EAQ02956.1 hypothetical protein OB2597_16280 [Pseudooceanicola batsensis HTCC2597]
MSDTPDIPDDDDRILAAEYVLGLLSQPDRRAFEARLDGDAGLRALVARWAEDFVALVQDIPEATPPGTLWRAIEASIDSPVARPARRRRSGLGLLGYALGGVLAAGLAWMVVTSGLLAPVTAPEYQARIAAEDGAIVFQAAYDEDTGTLELLRQSGAAAAGRSLEFWLIAGDEAPVSVIVWPTGASQEVVTLPADLAARFPEAVLAISDEPEGGSPTGQPTGDVLAVGDVQEI